MTVKAWNCCRAGQHEYIYIYIVLQVQDATEHWDPHLGPWGPHRGPTGKGIPRTKKQVAFLQLVLLYIYTWNHRDLYISVAPAVPYDLLDVAYSLRSVNRSLGSDSQSEFIIWPINPAPYSETYSMRSYWQRTTREPKIIGFSVRVSGRLIRPPIFSPPPHTVACSRCLRRARSGRTVQQANSPQQSPSQDDRRLLT